MRVDAIRLTITTEQGNFGFEHRFGKNLTIIRGRNSSGKSTIVNCLLYGLGMEEIIGGRGEAALNYAVKDWLEYDGSKIRINTSEVEIEAVGAAGEATTFRRAIKHPQRSTKLVEIAPGRLLPSASEFRPSSSTYLFDAGAAQVAEGFHRFLENFLGLALPEVPATNGGHTKLYLQTIFAALAVEQKRGWTDYIANIPFFGIRDVRTRVVEYLLGLDVFEVAARRSELDSDAVAIGYQWDAVLRQIKQLTETSGLSVQDVPASPRAGFGASSPNIQKRMELGVVDVRTYIEALRLEHQQVEDRVANTPSGLNANAQVAFDHLVAEVQRLTSLYEAATSSLTLQNASLADMKELYTSAREDLSKNRTTAKLRKLGAEHELALASDKCPTCHQDLVESLVDSTIVGPQMDLATNIVFLERQCAMFERQIAGLSHAVTDGEQVKADLGRRIKDAREQLDSARKDLSTGAQQSRVDLRRQLQIESEVSQLEQTETSLAKLFVELQKLGERFETNQQERRNLPSAGYSARDEERIGIFEKNFRANASSFEYESATVSDIQINRNALLPYLSQVEVRNKTDIKSDSSASDFVRLIWSYLLALYQTSSNPISPGNHPRILLLDEPGQHSMAATSQHALLQLLAGEKGLQSVVAASFDESEGVFREATAGVDFYLIQIDGKAIHKLS